MTQFRLVWLFVWLPIFVCGQAQPVNNLPNPGEDSTNAAKAATDPALPAAMPAIAINAPTPTSTPAPSPTPNVPLLLGWAIDRPLWTRAETSADAPWGLDFNTFMKGGVSARTGRVPYDGGSSWIELRAQGPGIVEFYWKINTPNNSLHFTVNGVSAGQISGATDWTRVQYLLPEGTNALRWVYYSASPLSNDDDAWVDAVRIESPSTSFPPAEGPELAEALDWPGLEVTWGGAGWAIDPIDRYAGDSSALCELPDDGRAAWVEAVIPGEGELFFRWKKSGTEGVTTFSCTRNGVPVGSLWWGNYWDYGLVDIPTSGTVVRWTFQTPATQSGATYAARLDLLYLYQRPTLTPSPIPTQSFTPTPSPTESPTPPPTPINITATPSPTPEPTLTPCPTDSEYVRGIEVEPGKVTVPHGGIFKFHVYDLPCRPNPCGCISGTKIVNYDVLVLRQLDYESFEAIGYGKTSVWIESVQFGNPGGGYATIQVTIGNGETPTPTQPIPTPDFAPRNSLLIY